MRPHDTPGNGLRLLVTAVVMAMSIGATGTPAAAAEGAYRRPVVSTRLLGGHADCASVSGDGRYVVFESLDPQVEADTNGFEDVYVLDRGTQEVELLSAAPDGTVGDQRSSFPDITPDGRYVVFSSVATNLVPGDTNGQSDIFVRDRVAGTTRRISVGVDGKQANGWSSWPAVSDNGRFVAFQSWAANLVADDSNHSADVFVRDLVEGTTERVSVDSHGDEGHGPSRNPQISSDGTIVAFASAATLAQESSEVWKVYVRDTVHDATELVSWDGFGNPSGTGFEFGGQIVLLSGNGRFVFYMSAGRESPNDSTAISDVARYDRVTGRTERISVSSVGTDPDSVEDSLTTLFAYPIASSADGQLVLFSSDRSLGYPPHQPGFMGYFVRNVATGETQLVTTGPAVVSTTCFHPPSAFTTDGAELALGMLGSRYPDLRGLQVHHIGGSMDVLPDVEVSSSAGQVAVKGSATFWGASLASQTDPAGDENSGLPQEMARAADLVDAEVIARPEQRDVLVRLKVDQLPPTYGDGQHALVACPLGNCDLPHPVIGTSAPGGTGPAAAIQYALEMSVGGVSYQVRAGFPDLFQLYRCVSVCVLMGSVSGAIGTTGHEVIISVPSTLLPLSQGAPISSVRAVTAAVTPEGQLLEFDSVDLPASSWPGEPQVRASIVSAEGASMGSASSAPVAQGSFSLNMQALPGLHKLAVRACLGDVCGSPTVRDVDV